MNGRFLSAKEAHIWTFPQLTPSDILYTRQVSGLTGCSVRVAVTLHRLEVVTLCSLPTSGRSGECASDSKTSHSVCTGFC